MGFDVRSIDLSDIVRAGKQDRKAGEFVSALLIPKGTKPNLRCYKISKRFDEEVFDHIALQNSVDRKNIYGGTAKNQVRAQITRLTKKLKVK